MVPSYTFPDSWTMSFGGVACSRLGEDGPGSQDADTCLGQPILQRMISWELVDHHRDERRPLYKLLLLRTARSP
eukprot:scaffold998_cov411-Prasinococcus_capsulatus_cf.AAC.14